jgi:hypothetical protein
VTLTEQTAKPMKRFVTVHIGEFSVIALTGEFGDSPGRVEERLVQALGLYLHDRDLTRPGWDYPASLPRARGGEVELELAVDEDLWQAFELEARRQAVTPSMLAGHAALYYVAEVDAGRITQRIVDHLEDEDAGGFENSSA